MPKIETKCEACGVIFSRYPSQISQHSFCSRKCAQIFTSARMSNYNRTANPMNTREGWSDEQRTSVRNRERAAKGGCAKDTYPKFHGRHEHRVVAERMLGRKLHPGEVGHHINGDKHDCTPENLMIFSSQKEHAAYHAASKRKVVI